MRNGNYAEAEEKNTSTTSSFEMASRAPSFVVVGLVLITFLVGFFYMSCSSRTTELQRTVDDFESRIRTLMLKNSDKDKQLDSLNNKKTALLEEKLSLKKQLEKKDTEISDLNTKLNERLMELRNLKTDKQLLDQRLKEFRNTSNMLAASNFDISRLKQELDEQKKSNKAQMARFEGANDSYKNRSNPSGGQFLEFANQRFKPLLSANETVKNTSSILQEPLTKISNWTKEIKNRFAPVVSDMKEKISNDLNNKSDTSVDQNIPAPPVDNDKEHGNRRFGRVDDVDNQQQRDIETRQRRYRSLNRTDRDTEQDDGKNNVQKEPSRVRRTFSNNANVANGLDDEVSRLSKHSRKSRIAGREERRNRLVDNEDGNQVIRNRRKKSDDIGQKISNVLVSVCNLDKPLSVFKSPKVEIGENNSIAISCDRYNVAHTVQDDSVIINFLSNAVLKLDRSVRCSANSSPETVNGCAHQCANLGYGRDGEIFLDLQHPNGTNETCSTAYRTELQAAKFEFFHVPGDRIRIGVVRPEGSFDYVNVYCSEDEPQTIFNTSTPTNDSTQTVDCSFLPNLPLTDISLETIKEDFRSALNNINREVPLPIQYSASFNSLLLTIFANAPPAMNLGSTYELHLSFFDKNNQNLTYERARVVNLNPRLGATFNYGLIPNLNHTITFKHVVNSTIYAISTSTVLPVSTNPYPYEVTNLRVREEFQNIIVSWNHMHYSDDPIEFIVSCNSNNNVTANVKQETTYVCENLHFNETNSISVETRIAVPNYRHDHTTIVTINIPQVPWIPDVEVYYKTETDIAIRWNYRDDLLRTDSFQYRIQCGSNGTLFPLYIQANEHRCESLEQGALHLITIYVVNMNNTIQRKKSILEATLLPKCRYRSHFYSSDMNGTRFVIIEWSPPDQVFDKIHVLCPSAYIPFQYHQITSLMYFKCEVTNGLPYDITFHTMKSGFPLATYRFTDTAPMDPTTSTMITTATTSSITDITRVTTPETTWPINPVQSSITTKTTSTTFATGTSTNSTHPDCSPDTISTIRTDLTQWRIAAIIAFIIAGFLAILIILLIIFSVILYSRNRSGDHNE
ncbi:unnamed protein product [Adineta ricciae]|uniref:Uncharacterized protein n=1 Tax=Adineta ricciae TaxID=249248 RepID=A0A814IDZ1_ADIRI|nr:unnamed protein product [Adineta ricciae]